MRRSSPILPTTTRPVLMPMRICSVSPRWACNSWPYSLRARWIPRGRMNRAPRAVLMGDRRPEQRHHAIAGVLVDGALKPVHLGGDALEAAVDDLVHLFRVELLGNGRETREVGEKDRNLATLAFEGAAGGEDLLGQVLRGVRVRDWGLKRQREGCGGWDGAGQASATVIAEGRPRWRLMATRRAPSG